MSVDWNGFKQVIESHHNIILTSHIRPDCDALGSELGMAEVLEQFGKKVRIVNGQSTPPNLKFIDPENRLQAINEDITPEELSDADLLIVLDTSAWAQLGPMGDYMKTISIKKIIVDHHVSEDDLGAEPFKDTKAEATGRLVIDAADALGVPLNKKMADPIYAAIATDTGWYRFPSAGAETYRYAARLIEAGANPSEIYSDLYERDSLGRVRLRGTVLARVGTEIDGALAHTYILKEDYENTGALPSDTEDLINLTLGIDGTQGAVIFVEQLGGGFKLSFRSRGKMDCSQVAGEFNGGGHRAAAGAFIEGNLEDVRAKVMPVVIAAMS